MKKLSPLVISAVLAAVSGQSVAELRVVVTKSRVVDIENTAAQTVITQEQINNSGARTIPELLNLQAGIQSRSLFGNNGADDSVDIRGFGATASTNTLVLLDGQRLNDLDLSGVDFADIPLSAIDRIEITKGGGSVLYGAGATAGVINLVTKSTYEDSRYEIGFGLDTLSTIDTSLDASGKAGDFSYRVNAGYKKSDGYRDNNELLESTLFSDLRYKLDGAELYTRVNLDRQDLGLPGERRVIPASNTDEVSSDPEGTSKPNDNGETRGKRLLLGAKVDLASELQLIAEVGGRRKELISKFPSAFSGQYIDSVLDGLDVQPRLEWRRSIWGGEGKTVFGFDYTDTDYRSERAATEADRDRPLHDVRIDQTKQAFYVQSSQPLTDKLDTYLGYRHTSFEQDAKDIYDANAPGSSAFTSGAAPLKLEFSEPSYEAGLNYEFSNKVNAFLNYARAVRFGTVDEYFELDASAGFIQVFSPLLPQKTDTVNVGTELKLSDKTSLRTTLFSIKSRNEIRFTPSSFTNDNQDEIKRRGTEVTFNTAIKSNMKLGINFTYQDVAFSKGVNKGKKVPLVSENTISALYSWALDEQFTWNTSVSYDSDKFFENDRSNTFGKKIPSVLLVNTSLNQKVSERLETRLAISNLLDEEYFTYGISSTFTPGNYNAYPLPGRVISYGLKYKF